MGKLICVPMLHVVGFILDVTKELLVQINPEEYNSEKYVRNVHKPTYFMFTFRNACTGSHI